MPNHPLAEVFGFPTTNQSEEANRHRANKLCPFNNRVPNCTKDRAEDPLGVCSVFDAAGAVTITCPVRFRQGWRIVTDAADFVFPLGTQWTTLTEVPLKDKFGKSAGNIDVVLLAYDEIGRVTNYGALEIQAVYISGNISTPFKHFMEIPAERGDMNWRGQRLYPRPDYLSSSRKRLAPQLIYKGGILHAWRRKMVVAIDAPFFNTLPKLEETTKEEAEVAWLIYELRRDAEQDRFDLALRRTVYTKFESALLKITRSEPGNEADFVKLLERGLKQKLAGATEAIADNSI